MLVFLGNIIILAVTGVIDIKSKKIPNVCVLGMLALLCVLKAFEVEMTGALPDKEIIISSVAGALLPFFLLMPAELMTKKAFGAGDKKALFVLGLSMGSRHMVFVLLGTMAGGLIFAVIRKMKREEHIAMAPFILISYMIVYLVYIV